MNIVHNLKKFFNEQQDEAAIPGLGVFFKVAVDNAENPLPEGDSVILFVEKTPRSNAFVNFFGYEENLTENEAVEIIEQWVSGILSDLKKDKIAYIPELGTFEIKKDKVIFTPAVDQNSQQTSPSKEYGLSDHIPNEITKKSSEELPSNKQKKQPMNRSVLWSIIGAGVVILIGVFIILGGLDLFQSKPAQPIVIGPAVIAEIDDEISDTDFVEFQQISQLQFAVIGGAFGIRTNAEAFLAQMRGQGYNAELIFDRGRQLHLVALGSFRTRNEAVEFRNRVRTSRNFPDAPNAWIYER
ncbi:MAG: SPOR domain-containing protein [Bacteroidales bacterium]|nr:SPOR domain-containing protein [Bacteroidales bacterium]